VDARFEGNEDGDALTCDGASVSGLWIFSSVTVSGTVSLQSMHATTFNDDPKSWEGARGRLMLDGFTYGQIASAPTDSRSRIAWLALQPKADLGPEFKPQPWEQLAAVLRAMGHPEEAREIAIEKQKRLRQAGKLARGVRPFHWLYGLLVGYGYRPMRLLAATASVWLICAAAYWAAANPAWFGTETHLLAPPPTEPGRAASTPDYRNFVPLIYSADVLLPVVDLGYKKEWQPIVADAQRNPLIWGQALRFLYWFEIAFGWVAGLLLVGVLGNLIKKD
jgi:hypothetical protein